MQQGLCALCGCTVTQSACKLDHVVPVRQLFADSVQRLQALCVDCHSEKTREGAFFVARTPAFFFPCQDEKLNAAETRASVAEARVLVLEREKARPFFFSGLGGTRKPVLQVDLMKEIASQARFPSFFSPPFWGGFPWSGHTRGGLGGGLAGRESLDAGLPGPLPVVFPPPLPPVAPRQADTIALRRELEQLKAHPSAVEIDRLRFRARAPRRRLRSVAVAEDPLAVVFPLFFPIDPSQECEPRPTFDLEKALGPAAFFWRGGFFQCRAGT